MGWRYNTKVLEPCVSALCARYYQGAGGGGKGGTGQVGVAHGNTATEEDRLLAAMNGPAIPPRRRLSSRLRFEEDGVRCL